MSYFRNGEDSFIKDEEILGLKYPPHYSAKVCLSCMEAYEEGMDADTGMPTHPIDYPFTCDICGERIE